MTSRVLTTRQRRSRAPAPFEPDSNVAPGCGLVITAIALVDDHRARVPAIEQVADREKHAAVAILAPEAVARARAEHGIGRGVFVIGRTHLHRADMLRLQPRMPAGI